MTRRTSRRTSKLIEALGLEPEARRRRCGGRTGRPLDPAVQAEEAGALLLVRPAVPERVSTTSYKVKLPPVFKGCLHDEKEGGDAKSYRCDYAPYVLDKLISGKFATSGSPAVRFVKKWKWTSADQNFVANLIAGQEDEAGEGGGAVGQGQRGQGQRLAEVGKRHGWCGTRSSVSAPHHLGHSSMSTSPLIRPPAGGRRGAVAERPRLLLDPRADRHARARSGLDRQRA